MEAVATGTAGKSGEILPLSFRLLINEYIQVNSYVSDTLPHSSLLGFGDAVIPGKLNYLVNCLFFCLFVILIHVS
ncbi:unnamed protein product [Trichobilharzia regenti]|nr:unnamed protein product [Trichobilharzia regenti]